MKQEPEITNLVKKARGSLEAAELLQERGFYDFSISRSYYAMFYITQAILLTKNLSFSKHKAVIASFGEHFANPGIVPIHLHRYLIDAFDLRQTGDYGTSEKLSQKQSEMLLRYAKEFIQEITLFLKREGYDLGKTEMT
jgi:uncharacterized protein (UPF0332 family)